MHDEDLTEICNQMKKKTKPEFQLRHWKASVTNSHINNNENDRNSTGKNEEELA